MRAMPATLVAVASAAVLAGCGSAGIDPDGFTAGDRKAAQAALDTLRQTSIPTALVSATATARAAPAVCRLHLNSTTPRTFRLFLFWAPPIKPEVTKEAIKATYTWFDATIGREVLQDTFRLGHSKPQVRRAQVLKEHAGPAFSKPSKRCQVLENGYLRLLLD
jgi:hypothetical protein